MVVVVLVIFLLFIFYWDLKDYFCFFGDEEYEMMVYIDCLVVIFILVLFFLIVFFYFQIVYGMYFKKIVCGSKGERCDI